MSRRTPLLAALLAPALLAPVLAGCGSEPAPLEALPPPVPADLCALLPEAGTQGLSGTASSSEGGNPTAACALRSSDSGGSDSVLVTFLQLQDEQEALGAYESQCNAIDRTELPEQDAPVEGADETCAGASEPEGDDAARASLAVLVGREVVTVRTSTASAETSPLERSTTLATGLLEELPRPE